MITSAAALDLFFQLLIHELNISAKVSLASVVVLDIVLFIRNHPDPVHHQNHHRHHQMASPEQVSPRQQSWSRSSTWCLSSPPGSPAGEIMGGNEHLGDGNDLEWCNSKRKRRSDHILKYMYDDDLVSTPWRFSAHQWWHHNKNFFQPTLSFGHFPPQCFAPLNSIIISLQRSVI